MRALPRRSAGQRLASGTVRDVGCDDREDKPGGQEPPPMKFGSKVERNYPHLEQSHQLQDNRECLSVYNVKIWSQFTSKRPK